MDKNDDGSVSESELKAGMAGRPKHEGEAAKQLGYLGITPGSFGYLIPGVAAVAIAVVDSALKVLSNPQLAQRTAKEFSADSPIKLLSASFGGYCYPAPPSDGAAEEKMQVGFLSHVVPGGEVFSYAPEVGELEPLPEQEQEQEQEPEPEPEPEQGPEPQEGEEEVQQQQQT